MKKLILFLSFSTIMNACTNDDFNNIEFDLTGSWKMVGYLSDPGDGSGTFTTVDSNKTITFYSNGTFSSNGNLCNMTSISDVSNTTGIYDFWNVHLNATECNNQTNISIRYEIVGNTMNLYYPCKVACYVEYEKLIN